MPEDIKQVLAERNSLRKENEELRTQLKKVEENLAASQTNLHELMSKTGHKIKTPYEYAENECRPVGLGSVCDKCGWQRNTQTRPGETKRSAHAIM